MSGPLQQLLGVSQEQRAEQARQDSNRISVLGRLLDDPNVTLDAKELIASQLEEMTNVPKQKRGLLPLFTQIFHTQQQQQAKLSRPNLFGNLDERIPDVPAGPDSPPVNPDDRKRLQEIGTPPSVEGRRRGSLTAQELADRSAMQRFSQQQTVKAQFDQQNDLRTEQRQLAVLKQRGIDAMARLDVQIAGRKELLSDQEKLRAQRDVNEMVAAGYPPELAAEKVRQRIENEQDLKAARAEYLRAQVKAIPDRIEQAWQRLDIAALRADVYKAAAENRISAERFNQATEPLFIELRSVRRQIEYFSKFPAGTPQAEELKRLQDYEKGILNELWKAKGENTPDKPVITVPERNFRPSDTRPNGGRYVPPKVKQSDLDKVLGLP